MVRRLTTPVLRSLFGRPGEAGFFNDISGVDGTRRLGQSNVSTGLPPTIARIDAVRDHSAPVDSDGETVSDADLERAIDRLTRALGTAHDEEIAGIVSERRAMREELEAKRREMPGNVIELVGRRQGDDRKRSL